jgi:hypothetical protein
MLKLLTFQLSIKITVRTLLIDLTNLEKQVAGGAMPTLWTAKKAFTRVLESTVCR